MSILRYVGRLKYKVMRLGGYVALFNTTILIVGFGWKWWYLLAFLGMAAAYYFEIKYAIPAEQDVSWKASKEWTDFRKEWDEFRGR